jgi:DNA recombination protein RmuC
MDGTTALILFVALVVAIGGGALVAWLVVGRVRSQVDASLAQVDASLAQRDEILRSAVDTAIDLAGDKLGDSTAAGARELDLRQAAIDQQIQGMTTDLRDLRELVAVLKQERSTQHGELSQALTEVTTRHDALYSTTQGLREALANTKARGAWGERTADDIVRHIGFVEGVNYIKQTAIEGGGIPDFTFLLPDGQRLHMDVKFPADNYVRALEATADDEQVRYRKAFLKDVRDRVKELSRRGYADADGTIGFTLLFIPIESIAGYIHESDAMLLDDALAQQVVLCSPSNLFAQLVVIRQAVEAFAIEQTSDEILQRMSGFGQQWGKFCLHMEKVDKQLDTVRRSFDALTSTRRNQLDRELDRIDDLRTQRGLPPVEATALDDGEAEAIPFLREVDAG